MKNRKISTGIITLALALATAAQPICAAEAVSDSNTELTAVNQSEIMPLWDNVSSAELSVNFNSSPTELIVNIFGNSGTTYTNGVVTFTKMTGSDMGIVKKWTNLSSSNSVFYFYDKSITPTKGTYRLSVTVKAVRNGVSESITEFVDVVYNG